MRVSRLGEPTVIFKHPEYLNPSNLNPSNLNPSNLNPSNLSQSKNNLIRQMTNAMHLMRHGGFDHLPSFEPSQLAQLRQNAHLEPMLREATPHSLLTLDSKTSLEAVTRLMLSCRVGGVMVNDAAGDLLGVITAHDVLRAVFEGGLFQDGVAANLEVGMKTAD